MIYSFYNKRKEIKPLSYFYIMLFKDIPGHESLKSTFIANIVKGKMAHARLFLGAEGSAAMPLALAYAQYIQCQQRGKTDSCGTCNACLKNQKFIHPDLHFSFPFAGKKDDHSNLFIKEWRRLLLDSPFLTLDAWQSELALANKQLNININECHQVHARLSMKPFESEFQILIMWLPEYLGKEGNSLLKLIEEPSARTQLIFVAENKELILPTILSRTQLTQIPVFSDIEVREYLQQKTKVDQVVASSLAFLSEGNIGLAMRLLTDIKDDFTPLFSNWMQICREGKPVRIVEWVEQFSRSGKSGAGRETQKSFMHFGLKMIREALLLSLGVPSLLRMKPDPVATGWFQYISVENAPKIVAEIDKSIYHIERNANPKILFLDVSLRLHRLLSK